MRGQTFMSAGMLRYRFSHREVPTATSDSGAEIPQDPVEIARFWAAVKMESGAEPFGGGKHYSEALYTVITHYRSGKRFLPTHEIHGLSEPYKGRTFNILAVDEGDKIWVTLRCREQGTSATP